MRKINTSTYSFLGRGKVDMQKRESYVYVVRNKLDSIPNECFH